MGQFSQWYPQYDYDPNTLVRHKCARDYEIFRTKGQTSPVYWGPCAYAQQLIGCPMSNATEDEKARFASAGIVLSLMPTTLALLGASTLETSTLSLIARRSLLAFLSLSSPAISPIRAFENPNGLETLCQHEKNRKVFPGYSTGGQLVMIILEYIIALAAVAIVAQTLTQLGCRCITASSHMPHGIP